MVHHGAICDGNCGVSGAIHLPAEIQGGLSTGWRCDKLNVPGLCLEQPPPVAGPLPYMVTATAAAWGGCRGFTSCCNSISKHIPVLSPSAPFHHQQHWQWCSSRCHPRERCCAPCAALPAGEIPGQSLPLPQARSAVGPSECGWGDSSIPSYPTHPPAFARLVSIPTTSLSLPIQTLLCFLKMSPSSAPSSRWQQAPPVAITTSSSPAKSARPCHISLPASKPPP